jgi:predicted DNA-binding transcriptional regulator AlpA
MCFEAKKYEETNQLIKLIDRLIKKSYKYFPKRQRIGGMAVRMTEINKIGYN